MNGESITHTKTKWVYNLINDIFHDTTDKLLPTMEEVTYTSDLIMLELYVTPHYEQPKHVFSHPQPQLNGEINKIL